MKLNRINQEITLNIGRIFASTIKPTFSDFEDSLNLFNKILTVNSGIKEFEGLSKTVLQNLETIFINNKGDLSSLKILSTELEPFYKKIIFLLKNINYSNHQNKTLGVLMQELELSSVISQRTEGISTLLSENNLPLYKGADDYLEYLCNAYIIRNQVHSSPNWGYVEIFTKLESILVSYFFPLLKYKNELNNAVSKLLTDVLPIEIEEYNNQTKALFDFISHGTNTIEIKKQILFSSILYYLYDKPKASTTDIVDFCNIQHNINSNIEFYNRLLGSLLTDHKIETVSKNEFKISQKEHVRLTTSIENYKYQEQNFLLSFKNLLTFYNIEDKYSDIFNNLRLLLETNYNIDMYEIFNKATETTNDENCRKFLNFLESILVDKNKSNDLLLCLLAICEENDFLHKLSASKVISRYTNSSEFQNYIRSQERVIFLDTQILLYLLCYSYQEVNDYNIFYKVVKELYEISEINENIKLKTSNFYINEAAYHLKEAVLLIPFEESGFFEGENSQNVFFKYYCHLRDKNELESGIESFADFLSEFNVIYDDIFNSECLGNIIRIITGILDGLEIEHIVMKKVSQESTAFTIFKNSLNTSRKQRQSVTIENDASLIDYLTDKYNSINEPYFLTWDTAFYDVREKYSKVKKGCGSYYLYSPSKFLTNLSLSNIEINPEFVTNEFISILNADDIKSKTNKFLDILNFIFDMDKEARLKRINMLKIFKEKYVIDISASHDGLILEEKTQPYSALIQQLSFYYNNRRNKYSMEDLRLIFCDDRIFENLENVIENELATYTKDFKFSDQLFIRFNNLIESIKQ